MDDDWLKKFWEIEDYNSKRSVLSLEEKAVVEHFDVYHYRNESGKFVVPLQRKPKVIKLGETRTQAMDRFSKLERSFVEKGNFS